MSHVAHTPMYGVQLVSLSFVSLYVHCTPRKHE